uniref:Uncharacterized protein n=1 Tax=Manihot esculenta TaxID=3983 RepID=A0A2C9UMK5_MANES
MGQIHYYDSCTSKRPSQQEKEGATSHNQANLSERNEGRLISSIVPRYTKLDFPLFNGTKNPLGWLNQCEQFF